MGKIYLIKEKDNENYKIGYTSKNIEERIKELQTGNGNKLILVHTFETKFATVLEKTLHRRYKSKNLIGEWFELDEKDVNEFPVLCDLSERNFQLLSEMSTLENPF